MWSPTEVTIIDLAPSDYAAKIHATVPLFRVENKRMLLINPIDGERMWVDRDIGELVKAVYLMSASSYVDSDKQYFYSRAQTTISNYIERDYPEIYMKFLD